MKRAKRRTITDNLSRGCNLWIIRQSMHYVRFTAQTKKLLFSATRVLWKRTESGSPSQTENQSECTKRVFAIISIKTALFMQCLMKNINNRVGECYIRDA